MDMHRMGCVARSIVVVLLFAPRASAQCIMPGSIQEEFNQATVVFVGTVRTVHYIPDTECCHVYSGTATFDVKRWWKGVGGKQTDVGAYGYIFDVGREYVVFAVGRPPAASACNRAKPTSESAETLRWLTDPQHLTPEAWSAAARAVTRLKPDEFTELPAAVRRELTRRGCTVPQPGEPAGIPLRNVAQGNFLGTGSDWAVLCSRHLTSSILVFRDGRADGVLELESKHDEDFLQGSGGGAIVFSRAIRTASPSSIRELQNNLDGKAGPRLAHAGIEDMFLGKVSEVWYWRRGKWVVVARAD